VLFARAAKPALFALALLPLLLLVLGAAGLGGMRLGANPVATIIDTLGLWGLRLLLATLALTPLRYLTGSSEWLRYRRMLGLFAFFYLCLHFTMYVGIDRRLDWHTLVEDVLKRPWITLGFSGLVLLVPLALTSTRAAMRRLGRRWQRLHYLVYPAAVLGCWHYYWQVKRDVRAPLAYAALLALLFAVRAFRRWRSAAAAARAGYIEVRADQSSGKNRSSSAFAR
jgi:sulfoxide reductase heme-binding subunit YedZ